MTFQPNDTIADYQILGILGQGGMGAVYRVRNLLSGREEAMKVVLPGTGSTDADSEERFLREIKIQASLQHPNIAVLRTAVRADQNILMIMELVEGSSLEAMLRRGPLPLAQAVRIADDILGALSYAHGRGVIHRDVKPANILVTTGGLPKLMDFGIARAAGDNQLTQSGMAVGSPHYMSPEQVLSRPVDERSDVYSMGATFYEMLTRRRPVEGDGQYAVMNAHLTQYPAAPAEINPAVSRELSEVVMKPLAKRPEDRFQTAMGFQAGLRQALFGGDATQTVAAVEVPSVSATSKIEDSELARVESRLASSVGPIAKTLVTRAAQRHSRLADLCREVAEQIPREADRIDFLWAFGLVSCSQPATPSASAGSPTVALDQKTLDAAIRALAAYLGPMAALVVKRTAQKVHTRGELQAALAAQIPDDAARRAFLDAS
ncbi:MAG TPA: serine/threonine-protein kinase [Bryobacteraceae bacterium]|jgi:serine/threonine-protein kinase